MRAALGSTWPQPPDVAPQHVGNGPNHDRFRLDGQMPGAARTPRCGRIPLREGRCAPFVIVVTAPLGTGMACSAVEARAARARRTPGGSPVTATRGMTPVVAWAAPGSLLLVPYNGLRFSCGPKPAATPMNFVLWLNARQLQAPG